MKIPSALISPTPKNNFKKNVQKKFHIFSQKKFFKYFRKQNFLIFSKKNFLKFSEMELSSLRNKKFQEGTFELKK